jgi:hypothetical protein
VRGGGVSQPHRDVQPDNDPDNDPDGDPDDQPDACIADRYADTIRIAIVPTTSAAATAATIGDMHRWDHHSRGRRSVVLR